MLTPKQLALLTFVDGFIKANGGMSPTIREMAKAVGCKSHCSVHRLLSRLEERGFVQRTFYKARTVQILKMPGESNILDDVVRIVRELERKAGMQIAVAVLSDIARDMVDRHETDPRRTAWSQPAGNA